eukprot:6233568-Amphidinium_carterae.1
MYNTSDLFVDSRPGELRIWGRDEKLKALGRPGAAALATGSSRLQAGCPKTSRPLDTSPLGDSWAESVLSWITTSISASTSMRSGETQIVTWKMMTLGPSD